MIVICTRLQAISAVDKIWKILGAEQTIYWLILEARTIFWKDFSETDPYHTLEHALQC